MSSMQDLVILCGEEGVCAGVSPHPCWSEQLGRRRSHQKGCHCGFGSALMLLWLMPLCSLVPGLGLLPVQWSVQHTFQVFIEVAFQV